MDTVYCVYEIEVNMPKSFKEFYPTTRCNQTPSDPVAQLPFSSYKNHNTFKALIQLVSHLPELYALYLGFMEDRELTQNQVPYSLDQTPWLLFISSPEFMRRLFESGDYSRAAFISTMQLAAREAIHREMIDRYH